MKNLKHHKKQVKQHQIRNRFKQWANDELDKLSARIQVSSAKRWDAMQADLRLQRCKLPETKTANANKIHQLMQIVGVGGRKFIE